MTAADPPNDANYFLAPATIAGHFLIGADRIAFTGTATGFEDGRFAIDVDDQSWPTNDYVSMHRTLGTPGQKSDYFALSAAGTDRQSFSSDTVWFSSLSDRGAAIEFAQLSITLQVEEPAPAPLLAMRLRGLRNFRQKVEKSPLGEVELSAPHNTEADDPAGMIRIQAPTTDPGKARRDDAEEFLTFVRSGMSLAHGGRLQKLELRHSGDKRK